MVQISKSDQGAVLDRSLDEDNTVARLVLEDQEYSLYNEWFSLAKGNSLSPDIIVFLEIKPQSALQRIRRRGESYEQGITVEYLAKLGSQLEKWIGTVESTRVIRTSSEMLLRSGLDSQIGRKLVGLIEGRM